MACGMGGVHGRGAYMTGGMRGGVCAWRGGMRATADTTGYGQ